MKKRKMGRRQGYSPKVTMRIDPTVDQAVDDALILAESGKIRQAEAMIIPLYEQNPDLHITNYGMGVLLVMQDCHEEALPFFDQAVKIYPALVEGWFNKATCHLLLNQIPPMIKSYQQVVKLGDPAEGFVQEARKKLEDIKIFVQKEYGIGFNEFLQSAEIYQQAIEAMEKGEWELGLELFKKGNRIHSRHHQSYGNMGICLAQLGRRQEALAALDKALELKPDYEPALKNRKIFLLLKEGEPMTMPMEIKDYSTPKRSGGWLKSFF